MKTEFKQADQEFEEYSEDETGQQDETVEFEIARLSKEAAIDGFGKREALTVDKGADFADESTESLEGQEKRTGINLGPNVQSFSLQDDHGNLKNSEEIKSKLFDVSAVKPLQLEFDAEEQGCTDEGELEMTPLQLGGMSADQMIGKWETSQHLEKTNQSPHRLAEMTQADVTTDIESTDEPKLTTSEGLPLISAVEEKHEGYSEHSAGEHQGVIDEEILDLWIETVMSDDTERSKEEDLSGPGLQKDQVNEESGETSFEDEREEEMKANSEEPASPSETETSLSTFEPGLLDQHFSEKTASTGLLEDINNIPNAGSSSEDVAEFSMPIFDSALVQETTEVTAFSEIRSYQDSGVSSPGECHPIQECATSQEKSDETKEKTGVEISAMCRDTEFEQKTITEDDLLEATVAEISEEIQPLESWQHRKNSQVESERQQFTPLAPEHRSPGDIIKSFPDSSRTELEENLSKVEGPILDFALQRSRIAVKNPRVRPPTDPRSLINMPSVDPTPSTPVSGKALPGVPLGGLGVGIKLPGLGAGFPVLRKTPRASKNEDNPETKSQESTETTEKKEEEEKSDAAKKDEAPKRPKWMPPGQPGFGNPLMSELKTKLKKTSKE
ncbi:PREDICTED: uncharacterized protein LOC107097195 [Cyprinodon variegatus]|uniref:uncharacterized protein LOC107097195 n=1 Tax=Cyprinodon variegatus TaxID=28743 RepID=UPI00074260B0|nr:PREDICTED: uncharacterized protein LOC107097195 [Cyprinodon variegatus]